MPHMYICNEILEESDYEKVKFTKDLFKKKDTWIIKKVQETAKLMQPIV